MQESWLDSGLCLEQTSEFFESYLSIGIFAPTTDPAEEPSVHEAVSG